MDTGKRVTATGDSAMTGTTRSAAILFATVAFAVGVFVSSSAMADDSGRCDKNVACADEVLDACGPNSNGTSCAKNITKQCKERLCTCTGEPGLPRCPVGSTTTTSSTTSTTSPTTSTTTSTTTSSTAATTSSSTTSTTTSSTTTTTAPNIQCCVPGSAGGAFTCELLTADACTAAGGINNGPGTCVPDPCAATTSTTTSSTTSTTAATTSTTSTST